MVQLERGHTLSPYKSSNVVGWLEYLKWADRDLETWLTQAVQNRRGAVVAGA